MSSTKDFRIGKVTWHSAALARHRGRGSRMRSLVGTRPRQARSGLIAHLRPGLRRRRIVVRGRELSPLRRPGRAGRWRVGSLRGSICGPIRAPARASPVPSAPGATALRVHLSGPEGRAVRSERSRNRRMSSCGRSGGNGKSPRTGGPRLAGVGSWLHAAVRRAAGPRRVDRCLSARCPAEGPGADAVAHAPFMVGARRHGAHPRVRGALDARERAPGHARDSPSCARPGAT